MTSTPILAKPPTRLSPSTGERPRVATLDGLRGIAILLVILYHVPIHGGGRVAHDVAILWRCGWVGVDLFFVLSGFLITGILYDAKGGDGYFKGFYARRALRIAPLYLAALFVCFQVLPALHLVTPAMLTPAERGSEWWFVAYLQNVLMVVRNTAVPPYMEHFWSLAVEEQFYLVWPFVVLGCSRVLLMRLSLAAVVAGVLLRLLLVLNHVHPGALYVLAPTHMDGLALGAYVALVVRAGPATPPIRWIGFAGLAAAALIGFFVWRDQALDVPGSRALEVIGYTAVALVATAALQVVLRLRPGSAGERVVSNRALVWLGRRSYGIYVIHFPAFMILEAHGVTPDALARWLGSWTDGLVGFIVIAGTITVALTILSWRLLEQPALRLRRLVRSRRAEPAIAGRA